VRGYRNCSLARALARLTLVTTPLRTAGRLLAFVGITMYGWVPVLQWILFKGVFSEEITYFFPRMFLAYMMLVIGVIVYLVRVPERWFPGFMTSVWVRATIAQSLERAIDQSPSDTIDAATITTPLNVYMHSSKAMHCGTSLSPSPARCCIIEARSSTCTPRVSAVSERWLPLPLPLSNTNQILQTIPNNNNDYNSLSIPFMSSVVLTDLSRSSVSNRQRSRAHHCIAATVPVTSPTSNLSVSLSLSLEATSFQWKARRS